MKTGLHSLPTELKQQIARCCADQDALLASALEVVRRDEQDSDAATDARPTLHDLLHRAMTANRSLTALAAVSREWNDLVAPVLFQALPIDKIDSETFTKRVLPRRGHHFIRLVGTWDHDADNHTGPRLVRGLLRALPQLPNLAHLHTPDLIEDWRADQHQFLIDADERQVDPAVKRMYFHAYRAQRDTLFDLYRGAESIMHQQMAPQHLERLFSDISGVHLKKLEFSVDADRSQPADLASVWVKIPNLDSLAVHIEMFDDRGAVNPVLVADTDPAAAAPTPRPPLRRLVLSGTYWGGQFHRANPPIQPSYAPFLRFAHQFADTLQTFELEIRCADYDPDDDDWVTTMDLTSYVHDPTPFAFTDRFPYLCRLVLRDLASASATLIVNQPDDAPGARVFLADAASRIPGFKVCQAAQQPEVESIADRLVEWVVRGRDTDRPQNPDRHGHVRAESTWPDPLLSPAETEEDPTDLSARVQLTLEHLTEWFRSARDAQDPDALAQMRDALESIDARRAVIEAWTGARAAAEAEAPKSKLEDA